MDIEGDAIVDPERGLYLGRRRGEGLVGGGGGEDDQPDLAGVDPGMVERAAAGFGGEAGGGLVIVGDVAAADPGPLDDPVVGGVDRFGQFGIGDAAPGKRRPDSGDDGPPSHSAASPLNA